MAAIRDIRTILTAPDGINLVVVKVETTEPELYGLGCATFTQRAKAVKTAVDEYLRPFLIGRDPDQITDIWHSAMVSGYWRSGPVLNNAVSGVDMALWDIKGKRAGMPVCDLLGGRSRMGAAVYGHASGDSPEAVADAVTAFAEQGYRYIRCQMGRYGGQPRTLHSPQGAPPGAYFNRQEYARDAVRMLKHVRRVVGDELELLHDVHERLDPTSAVRLAKELEPLRLFFLEDPLAPEDEDWLRIIRHQTATPIALGELFCSPHEWVPLISERLIDFIRVHISTIGGLTPAIQLAHLSEAFHVRTAWHGPRDVSPVGHAANLHLDLAAANFGIQEWTGFSEPVQEVFPGCPEVRAGYAYPAPGPGFGIDLDEKRAQDYPPHNDLPEWTLARLPDGTAVRP